MEIVKYYGRRTKMKTIYELIKKLVLGNEPDAGDEFAWLDKIFGNLPF